MTSRFSRLRPEMIDVLADARAQLALAGNSFLVVSGPSGIGKLETVTTWLDPAGADPNVVVGNGDSLAEGYLAGFQPLVDRILEDAETLAPQGISAAEQSLKRLFPRRNSAAFVVPPDLTGSAGRDERTRFYHHEYQTKLLTGLYEFLVDYLKTTGRSYCLVIDNADRLSRTARRLIEIIGRRGELSEHLLLVLLTDDEPDLAWSETAISVYFRPMSKTQALRLAGDWAVGDLSEREFDERWLLAQGNPARLAALFECAGESISLARYLSFETHLDLYLGQLDERRRYDMVHRYVRGHCSDDDPIAVRNYQTTDLGTRNRLHREMIAELAGSAEEVLHPIHHLSAGSAADQVVALAPLSITLQEIGLYDTWFDIFSRYWPDSQLRLLPSGGELHNLAYLRMSFVLYSLGLANSSIRYLEMFYNHFPTSLFTPTVLYSQSMAHGRYQVPPDLQTAERYALLNLDKIENEFRDHPKHAYIKVFAENALAYIRARQGRLDEALELCTRGFDRMQDIYGDDRFKLHQSILIYNTAQIYEMTKDFEKARETYLATLELDPNYGEYANDMANLLQNFGFHDEALAYYEQAIRLAPPYYEAHLNRARAYLSQGDRASAEADYRRVVEIMPTESRGYLGLGALRLESGDAAAALPLLERARYYDPANAQILNNLGLAHLMLGNLSEAVPTLQSAVRRDPRLHEGWSNLAQAFYRDGKFEESLESIGKALSLAGGEADYRFNRAVLYMALERWQDAKADLTALVDLGGDAVDIDELRQLIERRQMPIG